MSYYKRPGAAACIWCVALWAGYTAWAGLNPEEIYTQALPSVMTLEVENTAGQHFVGSAFLGLRDGMAVTAWHVVHDAQRVEARFADGRRVTVAGLVDKNEEHDLALLQLGAGGHPGLAVGPGTPRVGSRVYVVGTPKGLDFSLSEGLISQIREVDGIQYYQLSSPISPGDSGGPVLNDQGRVVGVISWRKATAQNVGFAIPSADLARLNPAHAVVPWPRGNALIVHQTEPPANGLVRGVAPNSAPPSNGSYEAFEKLLSDRAGKPLTVIVKEGRAERRFTFTVPKGTER